MKTNLHIAEQIYINHVNACNICIHSENRISLCEVGKSLQDSIDEIDRWKDEGGK